MKILIYVVSLFVIIGSLSPISEAFAESSGSKSKIYGDSTKWGGEVPFPWGIEVPFPWRQIEGVWSVAGTAGTSTFQFRIAQENNGTRIIQVTEMRGTQVIARGVGISGKGTKILRAVMNTGDQGYLLFVRAFKDENLCQEGKTVVVITVKDFGEQAKGRHHIIQKHSDAPICED